MPTETLHFESARTAQQLYNNDTRNLQALEEHLGVKATSREGWIKLEGQAAAIERAKHLFLLLENSLKSGSPVRTREFSHALNVIRSEGVSALRDLMSERIQTSDLVQCVELLLDSVWNLVLREQLADGAPCPSALEPLSPQM